MRYVHAEMCGRSMFALVALAAARLVFPEAQARAQPAPPPSASPPASPTSPQASPSASESPANGTAPEPPPPAEDADNAEPSTEQPGELETEVYQDHEFGPAILIEDINITGNTATQSQVIRRVLPITAGEVLRASDKRLREARFKVLALGFFRDVTVALRKGSQRGRVIVDVKVVERGTLVLNRLWFGSTTLTPWWLGADVGERNMFGLGIAVGAGFIFARHGHVDDARDQYAGELRVADPSVGGTRWGASWVTTLVHGSEPYRVSGGDRDISAERQRAFPYRRLGMRLGATYNVSPLTRLAVGLRAESISATVPSAPTRELISGETIAVDLHLDPGASRVVTASIGFDRDSRPEPILPHAGDRLLVMAELGGGLIGSSYDFATLFGSYEHYWPVRGNQALAIKLVGGLVVGDAPRFDLIHIADVDHMLTPRALGLVLSTSVPLALLRTRADKPTYGDLGGSASVEYAVEMFRGRGKRRVYGADVFLGVGLWGLADRADLRARDTTLFEALPIDIYFDAGMRLDTDIGTFELTIANAVGRLR